MTAPEVHGVLVLPATGDPLGLLAPGLCNAAPPCVALAECGNESCTDQRWVDCWDRPLYTPCSCSTDQGSVWMHVTTSTRALPLGWRGQLVPEGLDRLKRCTGSAWVESAIQRLFEDGPNCWEAAQLMSADVPQLLKGTLVFVDSQGRPLDLEAALAR